MKKTIIFVFTIFIFIRLSGQGTDCGSAKPFCIGSTNIYPAVTDFPSPDPMPAYPNFGCLSGINQPSYYYMKVANPGNFVIHISSSPAHDLDFICWGPFSSPIIACMDSLLTGNCTGNVCIGGTCPDNVGSCAIPPNFYPSGNIVDCSASTQTTEDCHINGAITGQYYMLLITNYENIPCNFVFTQTNAGQPGAGTTDCNIFQEPAYNNGPLCTGDTLKLYAENVIGASYSWAGPNGWTSFQQNPIIPNVNAAMSGNYTCVILVGSQLSPAYSTVVNINSTIPAPSGTITGNTNVNQGQQNVLYTVPLIAGAVSYIWELPSGAIDTTSTNSISVNYSNNAQSGLLKVKGHNGCADGSSSSLNVFVHHNTGTGVFSSGDIIVYPSPASLSITISYYLKKTQNFSLDVYDITGRKIKELVNANQHSGEHHLTLDTSQLLQGIYLLKATGDDSFQTLKFSVVH
ncbi:MAG: T9SS type A sorting domain-containing protein [Bacteroidota bacterium]